MPGVPLTGASGSPPGSAAQGRGRDARGAVDVRDAHRQLVVEAPGPVLARLDRAHDRVPRGVVVRGRVAIGRGVAAADVPALQADAQVHPAAARGEAVLAAVHGVGQLAQEDVVEVGAGGHGGHSLMGSQTWNVVAPGADSTRMAPSWRSTTMRRAVSSPRPVPAPTPLVVKNGSKTRSTTSGAMPGPSSATSTR